MIIDMGMGNIRSLISAFNFLGMEPEVSSDVAKIRAATHLILPGVGAFDAAMCRLKELSLIEPIREQVLDSETPILGICLGMQLLCEASEEGQLPGLRLVPGRFSRLHRNLESNHKVPHVGFSEIHGFQPGGLFEGLGERAYFYFTHSFALTEQTAAECNVANCTHNADFVAAFQCGAISGTQFHPEKSQSTGLRLLKNFLLHSPVPAS